MMKIKITTSSSGLKFPYGFTGKENQEFVRDSVGQVFEAERVNMNYYRLANGVLVHIYNAMEVSCTTK